MVLFAKYCGAAGGRTCAFWPSCSWTTRYAPRLRPSHSRVSECLLRTISDTVLRRRSVPVLRHVRSGLDRVPYRRLLLQGEMLRGRLQPGLHPLLAAAPAERIRQISDPILYAPFPPGTSEGLQGRRLAARSGQCQSLFSRVAQLSRPRLETRKPSSLKPVT